LTIGFLVLVAGKKEGGSNAGAVEKICRHDGDSISESWIHKNKREIEPGVMARGTQQEASGNTVKLIASTQNGEEG
jgi:hypothetical protein